MRVSKKEDRPEPPAFKENPNKRRGILIIRMESPLSWSASKGNEHRSDNRHRIAEFKTHETVIPPWELIYPKWDKSLTNKMFGNSTDVKNKCI